MVKKVQPKKGQVKKAGVKSTKKTAPKKKVAPAKKTAPVKKAAPEKKAVPKKKAVPAKKAAIVKKAVSAKKVAPVRKAAPVKAKKAEAAKAVKPVAKVAARKEEAKEKVVVVPAEKEPRKATVFEKEIRGILLKRRQDLLKEILESRARESDSLKREIGDIYDEASTERDRELSLLLGDRDRQKLIDIDEALQRIEGGEYGICENCGEKIAPGRLKAQPFTKLCINCKAEEERQEARQKRFEAEGVYRNLSYMEEEEV